MKLTEKHLVTALMSYFRFQRQCLVADQVCCNCGVSDLVADNGKVNYDIEVKISKSDLKVEKRKTKHSINYWATNYFYLVVPTYLIEEAEKFIKEVNPNYGLIEFQTNEYERILKHPGYKTSGWDWKNFILCMRAPKKLRKEYLNLQDRIAMRASSALANSYIKAVSK